MRTFRINCSFNFRCIWNTHTNIIFLKFGGKRKWIERKKCWRTFFGIRAKEENVKRNTTCYMVYCLACCILLARTPKYPPEKSIFFLIITWIQYGLWKMRKMLRHATFSLSFTRYIITLCFVLCSIKGVCVCVVAGIVDMVSLKINFGKFVFNQVSSSRRLGENVLNYSVHEKWNFHTKIYMIKNDFHENCFVVCGVSFFSFDSPISKWNYNHCYMIEKKIENIQRWLNIHWIELIFESAHYFD